ncbi:MAG: Flp pilus assembly complex ATPase component TadA [Reinekea forsetii]|jgi:MSHA biogenesis protein MshE|uniref:MSHA biogenesis protein MshE n=1 Tax=Reinekea forsetii TaxID=1336806 RepID=A0A2K8KTA3_9GAMM|nr:GspE/PulE family protein [Reinekea forsetii]ATX77957.1 MSHA biogenesis protein MshE [Reinekea forsetii]MDO7673121.1 Flp pilus assembly complex ATPase component TadA [Reinekea forsetii]
MTTQAASSATKGARIRLGDLLVEAGAITSGQLGLALQEQKITGKKIGRVLLDMGLIQELQLLSILSEHLKIPFIELRQFQLDSKLMLALDESVARRFRCLILAEHQDGLQLAMADPLDLMAMDAVEKALNKTIYPAIVRESELLATLDIVYRNTSAIESLAGELDSELSHSDFDLAGLADDSDLQDAPVVRLLQSVLEDAVTIKASDIHIEPDENVFRIRMRVDGVLQEQVIKEKRVASALVMRLKIMSNLDIAERRLPQDGRFNVRVRNRSVDIRISTMPVQFGESVVMRLLDQSSGILSLEALGMPEDIRKRFEIMIERPHGLILVTGPTGSGKTTTLYSALSTLNTPSRKIITAEDPIEYRLSRINQVQVNTKINLTFAHILRTALRQDPDIVLIGEMRDQETVAIGVRAAMTGHLVMSTLHTNDAVSSAIRLADMGVQAYMVATALRGILAQRLLRRICLECRVPHQPDSRQQLWLRNMLGGKFANGQFHRGEGCYHCNNTGYTGRIAVYEWLELDDALLMALRDQNHNAFIDAARNNPNFKTMEELALEYAQAGITHLDEVFRISIDLDDFEGDRPNMAVAHMGAELDG